MRWYLSESERKPDPEPAATNAALAIWIGIALWLIALAAIWFLSPQLPSEKLAWWPYTCVIGVLLGLVALPIVRRR